MSNMFPLTQLVPVISSEIQMFNLQVLLFLKDLKICKYCVRAKIMYPANNQVYDNIAAM